MQSLLRYRGREVTETDIRFIQQLIGEHPTASRRHLSKLLCQACNRQGHITLPPIRKPMPNPLAHRSKPAPVQLDRSAVTDRLSALRPLTLEQVRRTAQQALLHRLIQKHHYLGDSQPVGEPLKNIVDAYQRPIACLAWSSAPRHLVPRDRYIGWSAQSRRCHLHRIAYNAPFLILPWVQICHLTSHILGQMVCVLSEDWQQLDDQSIYYAETFVDPTRFRGSCDDAANWIKRGQTTGRGKNDHRYRTNRSLKDVLGYPLTQQLRRLFGGAQ